MFRRFLVQKDNRDDKVLEDKFHILTKRQIMLPFIQKWQLKL